jgi:hypothetical protein
MNDMIAIHGAEQKSALVRALDEELSRLGFETKLLASNCSSARADRVLAQSARLISVPEDSGLGPQATTVIETALSAEKQVTVISCESTILASSFGNRVELRIWRNEAGVPWTEFVRYYVRLLASSMRLRPESIFEPKQWTPRLESDWLKFPGRRLEHLPKFAARRIRA